jgi:hypothetical protein
LYRLFLLFLGSFVVGGASVVAVVVVVVVAINIT